MTDTIYAVSSGAPPAAIAVIRISGQATSEIARLVAGSLPAPRIATLRRLRDRDGETLDRGLVLWFPGPDSATGEDLLEFHVHGGRAVIAAVERTIAAHPGTRRAQVGEFTRRALLEGRLDLAQAAGLADLLEAETELQRRAALAASEGAVGREVQTWLGRLAEVRAQVEAAIDYEDEGDVTVAADSRPALQELVRALERRLDAPTSDRVREGWRLAIIGPPNAGKSSLFNALLGRDAAIVTPIAGTTRDLVSARVQRDGHLFTLIDTAGLAEWTDDPVEIEGIRRSREVMATADLVLWVSDDSPPPDLRAALWLRGRCDVASRSDVGSCDVAVSAHDPETITRLWQAIVAAVSPMTRMIEGYLLQETQHDVLGEAARELRSALAAIDPLICAEHLRLAGSRLGALIGIDHTEAMLDALFSRFCVGK